MGALETHMADTGVHNWAFRILQKVPFDSNYGEADFSLSAFRQVANWYENFWQWTYKAYFHRFGLCRADIAGSRRQRRADQRAIMDVQEKASIYHRRLLRGRRGQPMFRFNVVDITWHWAHRAAAFVKRLAPGSWHGQANGPVHYMSQYGNKALWKIYEFIHRHAHRRWILSLGALAGSAHHIKRCKKWLQQELQRRGLKVAMYKQYTKAHQPILVLPFHHKKYGAYHAKLCRIFDNNRHMLRHLIQPTVGTPLIYWAPDMPVSMGVLNHGETLGQIDMVRHEQDPEQYDAELRQQYCRCAQMDPKYHGAGIGCVCTPDLSVLESPELAELLSKGLKYRPDPTQQEDSLPGACYVKEMLYEVVEAVLINKYSDDMLGCYRNVEAGDKADIAAWIACILDELKQTIEADDEVRQQYSGIESEQRGEWK